METTADEINQFEGSAAPCRYTAPSAAHSCYHEPDPLTDWSAFGEILEWADRWTDEREHRLQITRTWEFLDGRNQRCYDVTVTHGRSMLSRCVHADFRTAVLAALSEAVGE